MLEKRGAHCNHHRFAERQDLGRRGVKGYEGVKKIKGRKRHLIVDTLGLRLNVKVLPANLSDREGGKQLLTELHEQHPSLKLHLYADGGYQGPWEAWVKSTTDFTVEVVERSDFNVRDYWLPAGQEPTEERIRTLRDHRSFEVVKKRWTVERSIAWMTFQRRLNRDYQPAVASSHRSLGDADLHPPDDPTPGRRATSGRPLTPFQTASKPRVETHPLYRGLFHTVFLRSPEVLDAQVMVCTWLIRRSIPRCRRTGVRTNMQQVQQDVFTPYEKHNLLTIQQVMARLQLGRDRVYQMVRAGTIPSVKCGGNIRIPLLAYGHWLATLGAA